MSNLRSVMIAVAFLAVAGNAAAERRRNDLTADVRLRHCNGRGASPITLAVAQSPRPAPNRADVNAIPMPLDELVVTGREPCVRGPLARGPRDLTPDAEVAVRHRRLLVKNRFEIAALFESTLIQGAGTDPGHKAITRR